MTLEDALINQNRNQYLVRQEWLDKGIKMRVYTANLLADLNIELTQASCEANDWVICDE